MQTSSGFGFLLRECRLGAGMTQEELAERSGLTVRAIAYMERGRTRRPYRRSVEVLADALRLEEPQRELLVRESRPATRAPAISPAGAGPAAVRPRPPVPRELPADVSAFTGRVTELAELDRLLTGTATPSLATTTAERARPAALTDRAPTAIISAVSGTAGVGKTALAVHWAHGAAGLFPDGQLYVNLRGYDPAQPVKAADALTGFLRALGVAGQDIPADQDQRAAMYRSLLAGQRILVVLDNARNAEQVRSLLPGGPGCAVLVTSRDSLAGLVARDGATRLDLDLLPVDDAVSLLRELIGARADADLSATAELARQCSRLPLALRVAAEYAVRHAGPLKDLVADLVGHHLQLDLLNADGDPRTAVWTVFSWSYRSLESGAARAFRLIGLHPGPEFDPYATAALADVTVQAATRLLDVFARAHLIQEVGPGRYAMHDLLRTYARELVAAEDGEEGERHALTRLLDYYLHAAASAMDTMLSGERHRRPSATTSAGLVPRLADPAAARAWLDSERPNLVAVVALAARHGWPGHATRVAATIYRYLDYGGHYQEGMVIHGHARHAARQTGDQVAEAQSLVNLATAGWRQGQYAQAVRHGRRALAISRQAGDRYGQARALNILGTVTFHQGSDEQSAKHLRQAIALYRELGDRGGLASAIGNLAGGQLRQGRYEQAAANLRQALDLFRETGNRAAEGSSLNNLGVVEERQGHYEEAASYHSQALELFRKTGYRVSEAHALNHLGIISQRQGRHRQALERHQQALALSRETGDRAGEAVALNGLGEAYLAAGRCEDARARFAAALGLASHVGNKEEQARAHNGLGAVHSARGAAGLARRHWQKALAVYTELGLREADQVRAQLATESTATGVADESSAS